METNNTHGKKDSSSQTPSKKQLLANPFNYFLDYWEENTKNRDSVTSLLMQRDMLGEQLKSLQTQKGIWSRQIGEAKRKNLSIEGILKSMQQLSVESKLFTEQIRQLNLHILKQLPSEASDKNTDTGSTKSPDTSRHDFAGEVDIEKIDISLLANSRIQTGEADEWNDYVSQNSAATIHHRYEWSDIHARSYANDSLYFCARDSAQRIVGILPLIHFSSHLFGNMLVSMPFFQRGGALADHPMIEQKLIQAAADYAHKMKIDHIEMRDDIPRDSQQINLPVQTHKVNMVLPLPDKHDALWSSFSAKLRAQVRRAEREITQTSIGHVELLDDFYHIYSRNMRDLGSPVQSKQFIKNILLAFPENSWLVIVRHDSRPVSAGFLLGHADSLEIPLASTIRDVNHLSINMLLYWEILKFAISHNFKQFDFGRSSIDAGTYRFKQQWGARPKQLYYHYWLGLSEAPPALNAANPKYAIVINIWKRLPVRLTQWIGPKLVKKIP